MVGVQETLIPLGEPSVVGVQGIHILQRKQPVGAVGNIELGERFVCSLVSHNFCTILAPYFLDLTRLFYLGSGKRNFFESPCPSLLHRVGSNYSLPDHA